MNELYRNLLDINIAQALSAATAIKQFDHPGLVGKLRESFISNVIRPFLPSNIGVGTGKIISAYDKNPSEEQDIIIFEKGIMPPILLDESIGLFPIESVLYVIEVKSKLSVNELKRTHKNATTLSNLKHLQGKFDKNGKPIPYKEGSIKSLNYCLFAYESTTQQDESIRYDKIRKTEIAAIRMICVANKGFWALNPNDEKNWIKSKQKQKHDEIACFLSMIINSYKIIAKSKGNPFFGNYIINQ